MQKYVYKEEIALSHGFNGKSLERTLEIAENCEKVDSQLTAMGSMGKQQDAEIINYVKWGKNGRREKKLKASHDKNCFRCGRPGHFAKDTSCPARGKVCRNCGLNDHFEAQCKTKPKQRQQQQQQRQNNTANMVNDGEGPVYAFIVGSSDPERIEVMVGGCKLNMIIDSGASVNIVDEQTWEWLKRNNLTANHLVQIGNSIRMPLKHH